MPVGVASSMCPYFSPDRLLRTFRASLGGAGPERTSQASCAARIEADSLPLGAVDLAHRKALALGGHSKRRSPGAGLNKRLRFGRRRWSRIQKKGG
jgi:hypothetical protein